MSLFTSFGCCRGRCFSLFRFFGFLLQLSLHLTAMPQKFTRWGKFAQFMTDHFFFYIDIYKNSSVMHPKVNPTISGIIVELRAQVLITVKSPTLSRPNFFRIEGWMYGPFFNERGTTCDMLHVTCDMEIKSLSHVSCRLSLFSSL